MVVFTERGLSWATEAPSKILLANCPTARNLQFGMRSSPAQGLSPQWSAGALLSEKVLWILTTPRENQHAHNAAFLGHQRKAAWPSSLLSGYCSSRPMSQR